MSIRLHNIGKHFGSGRHQTLALEPVNLDIHSGELVGLLGPSGSGKTTLLRIIAGLESADPTQEPSRILFGERDVTKVHVRDRRIGFVFQHYALFRHMTVFDNVAFGLTVMERKQREVLLLDEPFGALDAKVRQELRRWLRHLHDELSFTSVFVTHDQEEALELSDRVVVMSNGRIEQIDAPETLYREPKNRFVFEFLGDVNHLEGRVSQGVLTCGDARLNVDLPDGHEELLLRPHEVRLAASPTTECHLPVTITAISPVGAEVRVELEADWLAKPWLATVRHTDFEQQALNRGQRLYAHPRQYHRFQQPGTTKVNAPVA